VFKEEIQWQPTIKLRNELPSSSKTELRMQSFKFLKALKMAGIEVVYSVPA